MPIYEYQCEKCGHHLEALQKISDKPLRECPECGRHRLKRLMSAPLFRLAGSGWYETDFKSDKEQKRNLVEKGEKEPAAESKADAKPASKPESKTETKPEPKSATKTEVKPLRATASGLRTRLSRPATKAPAKPSARRKVPARGRRN
jgi:putative FmdB family regulatory protein